MLIYPQSQDIYPIGAMIQSQAPPNNKWVRCYGQIVAQSDYPALYNMMKNPHPLKWNNWNPVYLFPSNQSYRIIMTDGTNYVLAGAYNMIAYSTNLTSWTHITPVTGNWYGGCYGNSTFVVVGYNSTTAAISIDGGVSWTAKTLPVSAYWYFVCWDGTYFIAAGTSHNKLARSTDGNTWSEINGITTATSGYLGHSGLASDGAGTIVIVHNAKAIGVSTDGGTTWDVRPMAAGSSPAETVQYINGKFILTFWDGHLGISEDGFDWEFVETFHADSPAFYNIPRQDCLSKWVYGNGMYLGVSGQASEGIFFLYSTDLKTFETINRPTADWGYYMYDAIWDSANSRWFLISGNGGWINYLTEFSYDENTYFQFPYTGGDHRQETGKQWYIRVR